MAVVSIREFSHNPSAMFARVERGETLEVTRHGRTIASITPVPGDPWAKYADLVAAGAVRLPERRLTTDDPDAFTRIDVPENVDPLAILFGERDADYGRETRMEQPR